MGVESTLEELVRGFVEEAQGICERITRDLLELERPETPDADRDARYGSAARGLHTLKGSAGSLGLRELAQLAHRMEDVIAPRRASHVPVDTSAADALLDGLDHFMKRLKAHATKVSPLPDVQQALARIRAVSSAAAAKAPARPKEVEVKAVPSDEERSWRVDASDVVALMREVERLREVRLRLDERRRDVDRSIAAMTSLPRAAAGEAKAVLAGVSRALRADAEEAFAIVEGVEGRVRTIGQQPVRTILEPLHRAVRDLGRTTGKEAELSIVGGEVSLDRRALRPLKDAILQLVRNAVDHGIEPPGEREQRGKHREGTVVVRVEQQGNVVFVEVADDGRGLDVERIREVAVTRGLVDAGRAAQMDTREVESLIFLSGFSSQSAVTETSGRGVGLDVVRECALSLSGRIDVDSRPGQGTRCTITVPVEMGSSSVLVVRTGPQELGVPMLAIERLVPATRRSIVVTPTQLFLEHEGERLPLEDLAALVGFRAPWVPEDGAPILIVQSHGERAAIAVDEVKGDRDFSIRALPRELEQSPAFQGAATTAAGELVLILRPSWVVRARVARVPEAGVRRALVVDDSLTARALHRAMLEAGGYVVHTAASATQALELTDRSSYDVFVCDLVMEPLDGLALTALLRGRPETARVPIVIVSGRDEAGDAGRALGAGADRFLSKSDCARGRLLAEVSAVVRKGAA